MTANATTLAYKFPEHVRHVLSVLEATGHRAYVVGGAVRDLLLGRVPHDWDVATSATPGRVVDLFPKAVLTGEDFGTVTVLVAGEPVEVTTFRADGCYTDGRRPDSVVYARTIEADLSRRDFTVNAMAVDLRGEIVDPFGGRLDLLARCIRCVGNPAERFAEDHLRMLRAVRLAAELGFRIDKATQEAIVSNSRLIARVSPERVRAELDRLLVADQPGDWLNTLAVYWLLSFVVPELLENVGVEQNVYHRYTVWEHLLRTVDVVPAVLHLRLAALFHDIAKRRTLTETETGRHFYSHEVMGAEMTRDIMRRLRYPTALTDQVCNLVRHHMALVGREKRSDASLRRLARRAGVENLADLVTLWRADTKATGRYAVAWTKAEQDLADRVLSLTVEPPVVKEAGLAVTGHDVLAAGVPQGPEVGKVLAALLEEVLDEPDRNDRDYLLSRIAEMVKGVGT